MELSEILNDIEKDTLNRFINDKVLYEAVRKVLLSSIYFDGTILKDGIPDPSKNFALFITGQSNDEIATNLKAVKLATELLERGFVKLNQLSKQLKLDNNKGRNPAR